MRRLMLFIFGLIALIAAFTAATLMLGRSASLPPTLALLHLDSCAAPCWIGILPGQTTLGDARRLLTTVFGDTARYTIAPYEDDPDNVVEITDSTLRGAARLRVGLWVVPNPAQPDAAVIKRISLNLVKIASRFGASLDAPAVSLAELYGLLSPPGYLALNFPGGGASPILFDESSNIELVVLNSSRHWECTALVPGAATITLQFYNLPQSKNFQKLSLQPWRGFRSCYDLRPTTG